MDSEMNEPHVCSWLSNVIYRLRARQLARSRPSPSTAPVPVSQLCDILLCSLASLGTIVLHCQDEVGDIASTGHLVTLYISFSLPGLITSLQFFLPEYIRYSEV